MKKSRILLLNINKTKQQDRIDENDDSMSFTLFLSFLNYFVILLFSLNKKNRFLSINSLFFISIRKNMISKSSLFIIGFFIAFCTSHAVNNANNLVGQWIIT